MPYPARLRPWRVAYFDVVASTWARSSRISPHVAARASSDGVSATADLSAAACMLRSPRPWLSVCLNSEAPDGARVHQRCLHERREPVKPLDGSGAIYLRIGQGRRGYDTDARAWHPHGTVRNNASCDMPDMSPHFSPDLLKPARCSVTAYKRSNLITGHELSRFKHLHYHRHCRSHCLHSS